MREDTEQEKPIHRKREQEQEECNIGEQQTGEHRWPGEKTVKRAWMNIKACRHSVVAAQCYVKICKLSELSASSWAETRRLLGTVLCPGITGALAKCRFWNNLEHQDTSSTSGIDIRLSGSAMKCHLAEGWRHRWRHCRWCWCGGCSATSPPWSFQIEEQYLLHTVTSLSRHGDTATTWRHQKTGLDTLSLPHFCGSLVSQKHKLHHTESSNESTDRQWYVVWKPFTQFKLLLAFVESKPHLCVCFQTSNRW